MKISANVWQENLKTKSSVVWNGKLYVCMSWRRIGRTEMQFLSVVTPTLYRGEWSASRLGCFTTPAVYRRTRIHWMEVWMGPRNSLDVSEKRRISWTCRESNLGPFDTYVVAISTTKDFVSVNAQQDAAIHRLFYLWIVLHVSGGFSTHHQEHK